MIRKGFIQEEGVKIGENFDTGYYVIVRKNVTLGDGVCIWSNTVIDPEVRIGNRVKIHCNGYVGQYTIIEDDVFIGPGVRILNDRYPPRYDPKMWEPVLIKKGAIIGGGTVLNPGVIIGEKAIIGSGSLVIKDVPPRQVWAGHPARRLR